MNRTVCRIRLAVAAAIAVFAAALWLTRPAPGTSAPAPEHFAHAPGAPATGTANDNAAQRPQPVSAPAENKPAGPCAEC